MAEDNLKVNVTENVAVGESLNTTELDRRIKQYGKSTKIADSEQLTIFANLRPTSTDISGAPDILMQAFKHFLDVSPDEINTAQTESQTKGSKMTLTRAGRKSNILEIDNRDLEHPIRLDSVSIAQVFQDLMTIFRFTSMTGSFTIQDMKITDLLDYNPAYKGKRKKPRWLEAFTKSLLYLDMIKLKTEVPTGYRQMLGLTKQEKEPQIGIRPISLIVPIWNKNNRWLSRIAGKILPDIPNPSGLRAIAQTDGFFYLTSDNHIRLAGQILIRFGERQTPTSRQEPLKWNRGYLIKNAGYEKTDQLNKGRANDHLVEALNKFIEHGIIADWQDEKTGKKRISRNDKDIILIYPPKNIAGSYVLSKPSHKQIEAPDPVKSLKKHYKANGKTETANFMGVQPSNIEKLIKGDTPLTEKQIEKLRLEYE